MGSVHPGIPEALVDALLGSLGLRVAVESGTYTGTSATALARRCERVFTIEEAPELYEVASRRLAEIDNVKVVLGTSTQVLPGLLRELSQPALFWLDAHWSGGPTAGQTHECPVMDEIRAINGWGYSVGSCILIDDARLFLGPPPPPHDLHQWPEFMHVADALRSTGDRYVTILDDVVVALPRKYKPVVEAYWLPIAAERSRAMMANRVERAARRIRATVWRPTRH